MNLLLLTEMDLQTDGTFSIRGDRARESARILQARGVSAFEGQVLRAGRANVGPGEARVVSLRDGLLTVRFVPTGQEEASRLHLVLGIPRPKFLRRILPQIAAQGVGSIDLVRTWRTERTFLQSPLLQPEGHTPLLHEGMMQGGWTCVPSVRVHPRFEGFLETIPHERDKWMGSLTGTGPPRLGRRDLVVAVGPERGFSDYESERLLAAGFRPVRVPCGVMRTDTACVALLALGALALNGCPSVDAMPGVR
ncbi:MAG: RsmE family RNA methyltransferase [Myxococcota bacterium]